MLKYDAVSFSYPAGDNYEIKNRSFKELMQQAAVPLPPKHVTQHMHVVRFRFCIIGQMWQVTATVLER